MNKIGLVASLLALGHTALAGGSSLETGFPMVSVHASLFYFAGHANIRVYEDLFISRDGNAFGTVSSHQNDDPLDRWLQRAASGAGSAVEFAALKQTLRNSGVLQQSGGCTLAIRPPYLAIDGSYEIHWYALQAPAQNIFQVVLGEKAGTPSCPPEIAAIVSAIETYAAQANVPIAGVI